MMGPAGYLLAILGCGEGEANCQPVAIQPVRYESRAACMAATEAALADAEAAYPVMVADCRPAGTAAASVTVAKPAPSCIVGCVLSAMCHSVPVTKSPNT